MDTLRLLLALIAGLGIPWLFGGLWLNYFMRDQIAGRWALVSGYGYLIGIIAVTFALHALSASGIHFTPVTLLLATVPWLLLAMWVQHRWPRPVITAPVTLPELTTNNQLALWQWVIIIILLALLMLRGYTLAMEIWWQPLFPWDATMHWATKTRVFTEWQQLMPFVNADIWLANPQVLLFTDVHPHYPLTIPLIQTWMNCLFGEYHEQLMNTPWLGVYVALGLIFFGQVRALRLTRITALLWTYALLSLPLLNTHVALAGYADLFVGVYYVAALMALYQWLVTRRYWSAGLAIGMMSVLPLLKNEGSIWLFTFVPAIALLWLTRRQLLRMTIAGSSAGLIAVWLLPADVSIAGHSLAELQLAWHPDVLMPLLRNVFLFGNWHLVPWLVIVLLLWRLWQRTAWPLPLQVVTVALTSAYVLFTLLFMTTAYANAVIGDTSVSRIALHLMPATLFLCVLLVHQNTPANTAIAP